MENNTNEIIIAQIESVGKKEDVGGDGIIALQNAFSPHFQAFSDLAIASKDVRDCEPKKARDLRLKIKAVRLASESTRKEMKADSLRRGRAIDGVNNILLLALVPVEEGLEKIEKAEEMREIDRKKKLAADRFELLICYTENPQFFNLGEMPEKQFQELYAGMKASHEAVVAAEMAAAKAEEERIAQELADRAKMREENDRLAKVAAEERAAREAVELQAAKERSEAARLAKIETDRRVEAERIQREMERAERERERVANEIVSAAARAELERERAERARLQAAADVAIAAHKAQIAKDEADAKKAAAAPDREKVRNFADVFAILAAPSLSDKAIEEKIQSQIVAMHRWLVTLSTKIGE